MSKDISISNLILKEIQKKKEIKTSDIVKKSGFTKAYINRFFKELEAENKIVLIGKSNMARYVLAENIELAKTEKKTVHKIIQNKSISEDLVLKEIINSSSIFESIKKNIKDILSYSFTEMLNNAIDHSKSKIIDIRFKEREETIEFIVTDKGVGIFENIKKKNKLKSLMDAVNDLLKGKQTTLPDYHSGEGIFFTSKIADYFEIKSSEKKLIFDNNILDVFVKNTKFFKGTQVFFKIKKNTTKQLKNVFKKYTDDTFTFTKTEIIIKLYKENTNYISRSQARRLVLGLDNFKTITLDFKNVETIGQAFADEIFRVWQSFNKKTKILYKNAGENVLFMIKRTLQ